MKSVFLVKTPLQLINAIEAKYHFNLNVDDCVLIIMGDRKSQPQILKLANAVNEWGVVIILNRVNLFFGSPFENDASPFIERVWQSEIFSKSFFNVRRLNRISKHLGKVEYIFIGYARYIYMRHFVNVTSHDRVFLLDDGNATIKLAKERREDTSSSSSSGVKKKLKLFAKRFFQGVKDREKESLCFFTIYDVCPGNNDQIIKHNFEHIRSEINSLEVTNEVFFLGSPISESGIMDKSGYLDHLRRVKEFYRNKKLIYVAHRRELPGKLKEIEKNLGIEVVLFDYPIEYQLAMIGPRPKMLASFISSALDNCRLIFGDKLKIISFKLDLEGCPSRSEIESIYNSYESSVGDNFSIESLY